MLSRRGLVGCSLCAALAPIAAAGTPLRRQAGIIDVHAHVQVRDYLDVLAKAGLRRPVLQTAAPGPAGPSPASDEEASVLARLALMDAAGVRLQVLSPTLAPYLEEQDSAVRAARLLNDRHAALCRRHPGRLASYISLPLPHIDASLAEMRRGFDELGMVGVTLQGFCLDRSIAEARFAPLFEEMNRRRAVLFLHPAVNGLASPLIKDWNLTAAAGPLLEDTTMALHLMVKSIPARFPDIKIIVAHLGGGLATMLDRLDNQLKLSVADLAEAPSVTAKRLWYDTVSHGSATGLRAAVEAFGADRLAPGSDFPVLLNFETYGATFDYVRRAGLARAQVDLILGANAARLFDV